jgi:hypothetical protein
MIRCMRTTLDIDDDVLLAAKELARRERKTAGRVLSELARCGLAHANDIYAKEIADDEVFLGFRPFARRGAIVTNEIINRLREEDVD